jgi:hypothetical protein
MAGSRIAAAAEALRQISLRLVEQDRFGVVAFDAEAEVLRHPAPPSAGMADELAVELAARGVGLGTNLASAWQRAAQVLSRGGVPGASKTILLLTDGLPSRGLRAYDELEAMVRAGAERGLVTNTVGIGDRFDEELLVRMARAGGGGFRFAQNDEDTEAIAEEEIDGLTRLVAEDALLHLGFAASVSSYEVVHDLRCRPDGDDGVAVELGRLFAGRPRSVLLSLRCAEGGAAQLGVAALSFSKVNESLDELGPVRIERPDERDEAEALQRVGAVVLPLRVAYWLQCFWTRGLTGSRASFNQMVQEAQQELNALSNTMGELPDAQRAVQRFAAVVGRLKEIMTNTTADERERQRQTSMALKGIREKNFSTVLGLSQASADAPVRRGGGGRRE